MFCCCCYYCRGGGGGGGVVVVTVVVAGVVIVGVVGVVVGVLAFYCLSASREYRHALVHSEAFLFAKQFNGKGRECDHKATPFSAIFLAS